MALITSTLIAISLFTPKVFGQEVQNISLTIVPQQNGSPVAEVTWEPPADLPSIAHYRIYQIQGVGIEVSQPYTLPATASALHITDVPEELLGVSIQVVWKDGRTSHGAFASIDNGNPTPPPPLVAALPFHSSPRGLSREDVGMVLFVMIAGGIVGVFGVRLLHRA